VLGELSGGAGDEQAGDQREEDAEGAVRRRRTAPTMMEKEKETAAAGAMWVMDWNSTSRSPDRGARESVR